MKNMVMSTVAEQLRLAREAKQLTVEQVAEMTKIRTDHLRALEEGNFAVFSAPIYIRGSVKNYAAALKLEFILEPGVIIIAVLFSAAVGVAFGYFPARRAARLDPIEALRHE